MNASQFKLQKLDSWPSSFNVLNKMSRKRKKSVFTAMFASKPIESELGSVGKNKRGMQKKNQKKRKLNLVKAPPSYVYAAVQLLIIISKHKQKRLILSEQTLKSTTFKAL